jgi:hypothetical protein
VRPLCGAIFADDHALALARPRLQALLGPFALVSETWPFDLTRYYEPEMGAGLRRVFIAFERLADPAGLADWKLATNRIEAEVARDMGRARPINLDPGYLTPAKLVLATTKDFSHRVYLREGIFAEITLSWREGGWVAHPWTFPDYRDARYHGWLSRLRDLGF